MKTECTWLIILVGLGGCAVGPDYHEAVPIVPDRWQAGRDANSDMKPVDPQTLKNWWKNFSDAGLDRLMEQA